MDLAPVQAPLDLIEGTLKDMIRNDLGKVCQLFRFDRAVLHSARKRHRHTYVIDLNHSPPVDRGAEGDQRYSK